METSLDTTLFVAIVLATTCVAALVAGLAGFAFGLVAAAVWLYILTPLQTATLIIWFGLIVQGYAVWKLRHAISWRRIVPLLIGAAMGVPLGVFALSTASPRVLRIGVGAVLVLYSVYGLVRPAMKPVTGSALGDAAAGVINGALGGATGFAGIVATIWCQLRGWPKDQKRAVFQPVAVATFAMSAAWLGGQGSMSADMLLLFALGLPALLLGNWAGIKLYGKLDETQFRKIVLILLLASGAVMLSR